MSYDWSDENWRDEALTLRAGDFRSYLFLCVANSARSQMAEGVARGARRVAPALGCRLWFLNRFPADISMDESVRILREVRAHGVIHPIGAISRERPRRWTSW